VHVVSTLTGVEVNWSAPVGDPQYYVVHRWINGTESTFTVPETHTVPITWADPVRQPGATYAVSAVNDAGASPASEPAEPSPTRQVIAAIGYDADRHSFLGQMNAEAGQGVVPIRPGGVTRDGVHDLAVSPDGRFIAFTHRDSIRLGLWVIRADAPSDAEPVKLAPAGDIDRLAWSPDGTRIAYERKVGSDKCVEIVAVAGGTAVQVGCAMSSPAWQPDGNLIVTTPQWGLLERVQAAAGGRLLGVISMSTAVASRPAVSPDGRWIAFGYADGSYNGRPKAAVMPLTGGTVNFGPLLSDTTRFSWRPDGRAILTNNGVMDVATDGSVGELHRINDFQPGWSCSSCAWEGIGLTVQPSSPRTGAAASIPFDPSALAPGSTVTCQLDANSWAPCTSPLQLSDLPTGVRTVRVRAVEPDGRIVIGSRIFVADGTKPTMSILTPTASVTTTGGTSVNYSGASNAGLVGFSPDPPTLILGAG